MTTTADNLAAARRWREQWGYVGRGGAMVLIDGEVQSWVNQLRNPDHRRPGCVAIDESGKSWTAIAGNGQDGTLMSVPDDPIAN